MHQNISKWEITLGNHPNDDHNLGCLCRNSDADDIIDVAPDQWDQHLGAPLIPMDKAGLKPETSKLHRKKEMNHSKHGR
jgi:hypothetical protein